MAFCVFGTGPVMRQYTLPSGGCQERHAISGIPAVLLIRA